ncbi:MAG: helix-turn-helix domain-containing protein [Streptosporangiaceae bacterium]
MNGSAAAGQAPSGVSDHTWRAPPPVLRELVDWCAGYRDIGIPPAKHRGLPSPGLTLIFTLDDRLTIAEHPDPAQPADSFDTLVGGLHTRPALITHEGRQSGIQLGLSPLGSRVLLGMPAAELAGIDVHGRDVLGGFATELQDRLRMAASWDERLAILEQALLCRMRQADERAGIGGEVLHAWQRLLRSGGTTPVADLAAETGWSDRHLRARFRAEIGLAPKAAARVIRFDRARRILQRRAAKGEALQLAELAASCGYFDQAHLDREFGLLAGCSPTTWVRTEFRNLQVSADQPLQG